MLAAPLCGQGSTPEGRIAGLRRSIASVKDELQRTSEQRTSDSVAFVHSLGEHERVVRDHQARIDSLAADVRRARQGADSLAGVIAALRDNRREFELLQGGVHRVLVRATDSLAAFLAPLPREFVADRSAAVAFLNAEFVSRSIDNAEGVERLWQLIERIGEDGSSIDAHVAASPLPALPGQVSFLRLGLVWFALVNDWGTGAALWYPDGPGGEGEWRMVRDALSAARLGRAVAIYTGNAVPQVVDLPFDLPLRTPASPGGEP